MSNVVGSAQVEIEPTGVHRFQTILEKDAVKALDRIISRMDSLEKRIDQVGNAARQMVVRLSDPIKLNITADTSKAVVAMEKLKGVNVSVDLIPDSTRFSSRIEQLRGTNVSVDLIPDTGKVTSAIDGLRGRNVSVDLVANTAGANEALNETQDKAEGMAGGFSTMFAGLGTAAVYGVGRVIAQAGKLGIATNASLEQSQIAFTGLLGSEEKAKDMMAKLVDFAAKTPFELPDVTRETAKLLGIGIAADKVIPTLQTIGDVAADLGVSSEGIDRAVTALGQMKGKGKASSEELQQISEALPGFSAIGAVAKSMGISTQEAFKKLEAGAIPADQAIQAILKGMAEFPGAANAMERQSRSLSGMLSTLKDTISVGLAGALGPLADKMKDLIPPLTEALTGLFKQLGDAIGPIASGFGQVFAAISPVLGTFFVQIGKIANVIGEQLAPIITTVSPYVEEFLGLLGDTFVTVLQAIGPPLNELLGALAPLLPMFAGLAKDIISAVAPALGELIRGLVPVVEAITAALMPALEAMKPIWPQVSAALVEIAKGFAGVLKALTPMIGPIVKLFAKMDEAKWEHILIPAMQAFADLLVAITPAIEQVAIFIGDLFTALDTGDFTTVQTKLSDLWTFITTWVTGTAIPWLQANIPLWWDAFTGWVETSWPIFEAKLQGWLEAFGNWVVTVAWPWIQAQAGQLASAFSGWVSENWPVMQGQLQVWAEQFGNWIQTVAVPWIVEKAKALGEAMLMWVADQVKQLPDRFIGWLDAFNQWLQGTAYPWIADKAGQLTEAFTKWIAETVSSLPGKFAEISGFIIGWIARQVEEMPGRVAALADNIMGWIGTAITEGPGKLQKLADTIWDFMIGIPERIKEIGGKILEGLWKGIQDAVPQMIENIKSVPGQFIDAFKKGFGISSPSKLMMPVGAYVAEGFMVGMNSGLGGIADTANQWASAALAGAQKGVAAAKPDLQKVLASKEWQTALAEAQWEGGQVQWNNGRPELWGYNNYGQGGSGAGFGIMTSQTDPGWTHNTEWLQSVFDQLMGGGNPITDQMVNEVSDAIDPAIRSIPSLFAQALPSFSQQRDNGVWENVTPFGDGSFLVDVAGNLDQAASDMSGAAGQIVDHWDDFANKGIDPNTVPNRFSVPQQPGVMASYEDRKAYLDSLEQGPAAAAVPAAPGEEQRPGLYSAHGLKSVDYAREHGMLGGWAAANGAGVSIFGHSRSEMLGNGVVVQVEVTPPRDNENPEDYGRRAAIPIGAKVRQIVADA